MLAGHDGIFQPLVIPPQTVVTIVINNNKILYVPIQVKPVVSIECAYFTSTSGDI